MNDQESFDRQVNELLELIRFIERVSTKLYALPNEDAIYRMVCDEFARFGRYTVSIARLMEDGTKLEIVATSSPSKFVEKAEILTDLSLGNFTIDLLHSTIYRQYVACMNPKPIRLRRIPAFLPAPSCGASSGGFL